MQKQNERRKTAKKGTQKIRSPDPTEQEAALPAEAEALAESALFWRGVGYRYVEQTFERVKDPQSGEYRMTVTKQVEKQLPANTTALIYWMKVKMPELWGGAKPPEEEAETEDSLLMALDGLAAQLPEPDLPEEQDEEEPEP